jgi:hypothetical protein
MDEDPRALAKAGAAAAAAGTLEGRHAPATAAAVLEDAAAVPGPVADGVPSNESTAAGAEHTGPSGMSGEGNFDSGIGFGSTAEGGVLEAAVPRTQEGARAAGVGAAAVEGGESAPEEEGGETAAAGHRVAGDVGTEGSLDFEDFAECELAVASEDDGGNSDSFGEFANQQLAGGAAGRVAEEEEKADNGAFDNFESKLVPEAQDKGAAGTADIAAMAVEEEEGDGFADFDEFKEVMAADEDGGTADIAAEAEEEEEEEGDGFADFAEFKEVMAADEVGDTAGAAAEEDGDSDFGDFEEFGDSSGASLSPNLGNGSGGGPGQLAAPSAPLPTAVGAPAGANGAGLVDLLALPPAEFGRAAAEMLQAAMVPPGGGNGEAAARQQLMRAALVAVPRIADLARKYPRLAELRGWRGGGGEGGAALPAFEWRGSWCEGRMLRRLVSMLPCGVCPCAVNARLGGWVGGQGLLDGGTLSERVYCVCTARNYCARLLTCFAVCVFTPAGPDARGPWLPWIKGNGAPPCNTPTASPCFRHL